MLFIISQRFSYCFHDFDDFHDFSKTRKHLTLVADARSASNRRHSVTDSFVFVPSVWPVNVRGQRRASARKKLHAVAWRALRIPGAGKGNPRSPAVSVRAHARAWRALRFPGVGKGNPRSPGGSVRAHASAWRALRVPGVGKGSPRSSRNPPKAPESRLQY